MGGNFVIQFFLPIEVVKTALVTFAVRSVSIKLTASYPFDRKSLKTLLEYCFSLSVSFLSIPVKTKTKDKKTNTNRFVLFVGAMLRMKIETTKFFANFLRFFFFIPPFPVISLCLYGQDSRLYICCSIID